MDEVVNLTCGFSTAYVINGLIRSKATSRSQMKGNISSQRPLQRVGRADFNILKLIKHCLTSENLGLSQFLLPA